jgi:hypothetical protein
LAFVLLVGAAGPVAARAAVGVQDSSYTGTSSPTGEKPQSKLWFNDGSWWGSVWSSASSAYDIQRFDAATQSWVDTAVVIDRRAKSQADMLWDGGHLYAVSAIHQGGATSDPSVRLYRFSYSAGARSYSLDPGFPVVVFRPASSADLETAALDRDATGVLWATFTYANAPGDCATPSTCPAGRSVFVAHSLATDGQWAAPFVLPVAHASEVSGDDISAIVHFGSTIGVLFSDEVPDQAGQTGDYFAWHPDGAPDRVWTEEVALAGTLMADDHISLKAAPDGRVYAAAKTSRNDPVPPNPDDPLIMLLERTSDGVWHQTVFDTVASEDTRSQILLDPAQNAVYQFATYPPDGVYESGGWIYCKVTSMDAPAFTAGRGTPFIQLGASDHLNNISSTKQPVGADTGLFAIAADDNARYYAHGSLTLGGPPSCAGDPITPSAPGTSPAAPVVGTPSASTSPSPSRSACKVSSASVKVRSLSRRLAAVAHNAAVRVRVRVRCALRLKLSAALDGPRGALVGRASVHMKRGQTRIVSVKLTRAGRRLLAHRRRARLRIIARTPAVKGVSAKHAWTLAVPLRA